MTEQNLHEELERIFLEHSSVDINIIVPDPNDTATLKSWNDLKGTLTGSINRTDAILSELRNDLDTFDTNSSTYNRQISTFVQQAKELLITSTLNPDEERFFENFSTQDNIHADSVMGWDENTKALSLPIEVELSMHNSVSNINIEFGADSNDIRRNLGHLAGHVEANEGNLSILEPDDRQNFNNNPNVLLDHSKHNILEVEQVILLRDTQNIPGINSTGEYLIENYNPTPFRTLPIPVPETVLWSRPSRASYDRPQKVTINVTFSSAININKTILTQQPINGELARIDKVSVTLENGVNESIQEYPTQVDKSGNIFSTLKVKSIRWEITQTSNQRSPMSFQHWVSTAPLDIDQHPRHLFIDSAIIHQEYPALDRDFQLAILEKVLNAGAPIDELRDNQLPPWARRQKGPVYGDIMPEHTLHILPEEIETI